MQEVANARAALAYCCAKYVQARFFSLAPLLIGVIPDPYWQAVLDIMPSPARKLPGGAKAGIFIHCLGILEETKHKMKEI